MNRPLFWMLLLVMTRPGVAGDFLGLSVALPRSPAEPVVRGPVRAWEWKHRVEDKGGSQAMGVYSVQVTDLRGMPQRVDEDMALALHERSSRHNKVLAGPNLRRVQARIGDRRMILLNGSVIAPGEGGVATNSFWLSACFVFGELVYEVTQITVHEVEHRQGYDLLRKMVFRPPGGRGEMKVTGVPDAMQGDYSIAGVPFVLQAPQIPLAAPSPTNDGTFASQYNAKMQSDKGPTWLYKVRLLQEGDPRSDSKRFRELASDFIPVQFIPEDRFQVSSDYSAFEADVGPPEKRARATLKYARNGRWIAVLLGIAPPAHAQALGAAKIKKPPVGGG